MFRLASCHEIIALKEEYPDFVNPKDENSWGLKENGKLWICDYIKRNNPAKILEVGAGLNLFIPKFFGNQLEYWMIDSGDLYPNPKEFRNEITKISEAKEFQFIDSLIGNFNSQLPDNYFDLLFSISALEHTPREPKDLFDKVSQDMFRVLKPGGYMFHSIDVVPSNDKPELFRKAFLDAGFVFVEEPQELDWNVGSRDNQILLEMLRTVHLNYNRKQRENNIPIKWYHFGSVLVLAQKPE